jgi:uncharacterized protein involved in exopolysaccharide biosynthesis
MSEPGSSATPQEEVNLRPFWQGLRRQWLFILAVTFIVGFAGLFWMWISAPKYEATAAILFPPRPMSALAMGGSGAGGGLQSLLGGGPNILRVNEGILKSTTVMDFVVESTGLQKRIIESNRQIRGDQTSNILTISYEAGSPEEAVKVVQLHIDALRTENDRLNVQAASSDEKVLAESLAENSLKLDRAQQELTDFLKQAQTVPEVITGGSGDSTSVLVVPGSYAQQLQQAQVELNATNAQISRLLSTLRTTARLSESLPTDIPAIQKWRQRLIELEYDLNVKRITLGPEAQEVQRVQDQIAITRKQLDDEARRYVQAVDADAVDSPLVGLYGKQVALQSTVQALSRLVAVAPEEANQLQSILREVGSLSAIVNRLRAQLETARLLGATDPTRWQVLDEPQADPEPTNKRVVRTTATWFGVGFILGLLLASLRVRTINGNGDGNGNGQKHRNRRREEEPSTVDDSARAE